jgi:hypothetical protein
MCGTDVAAAMNLASRVVLTHPDSGSGSGQIGTASGFRRSGRNGAPPYGGGAVSRTVSRPYKWRIPSTDAKVPPGA